MPFEFNYKPDGETLIRFHQSDAFFRGIRGHIGSGKSVACAVELFLKAMAQERGKDGIRRTRAAVIRNTTPQLKTTTIKTWLEWFPEDVFGKVKWDPPITHRLRVGDVDMEVIFLALDNEKDIRKLLSLELTFAWVNEAREITKEIMDGVTSRVRRYPSRKSGVEATWAGVIADTNPPGPHHWWGIMSGEVPPPEYMSDEERGLLVKPGNWEFFTQPPAMLPVWGGDGMITGYNMNPARENARYLNQQYYLDQLPGKTRDWISVYILNNYAELFSGRPVYSEFSEKAHVTRDLIPYIPGQPVYVGMDFGLTPAAVFGQRPRRRWLVQRELVAFNMGVERFAERFTAFAAEHYPPEAEFVITGDPAGDTRVQTNEQRVFEMLHVKGVLARAASTNNIDVRIAMVNNALTTMQDGAPCYLISEAGCPVLTAAKKGGYHYDKHEKPEKNEYSHVSDAEQYMMDGAGEARRITNKAPTITKPVIAKRNFSVFRTQPFHTGLRRQG